jgi:hypothetical protein
MAGLYLGLSNYCLSYALFTGESHHGIVSGGQVSHHPEGHDAGHDAHLPDQAPGHQHQDSSDACCATFNAPGLLLPSAAHLLAKASFVALPAFFAAPPSDLFPPAECYLSRSDHGPPKPSSQDAVLSRLAPRAPPALT